MKLTPKSMRAPAAGSALTLAICATFGVDGAQATEIVIPIDVFLGTYNLDFDRDGTPEYTFSRTDGPVIPDQSGNPVQTFQNDIDSHGNGVVGSIVTGTDKPGTYASRLGAGELIDGTRSYVADSQVILSGKFLESFGEFYGHSGFAGLQFDLSSDGSTHYGWAELRDPPGPILLVRAGWNDTPETAVVTPPLTVPEPGTLALLAAGAAGVLAMRRRQRAS